MGTQKGLDRSGWISVGATIVFVILSAIAPRGSTYRFSFVFLSVIQWFVYSIRHRLHLSPFHVGLFASALLVHDLGTFGLYRSHLHPFQFDAYVHFYFGMVGGFLLRAGLKRAYGLAGWRIWLAVAIGMLGFGAVHELIEWISTLMLGPERGMLKILPDDPYDTQEDLMNNLLGALLSLAISSIPRRRKRAS